MRQPCGRSKTTLFNNFMICLTDADDWQEACPVRVRFGRTCFFYISKIYSTFTCDFKNKNDTYYDKSKTTSVAV